MRRIVLSLVVLLLVLNILLISAEGFIRLKMRHSNEPLARGSAFPPLAGVAKSGAPLREDANTAHGCHVVRFANLRCPACAPAHSQGYVLLAGALSARGCDITVLSPNGSDLPALEEGLAPRQMKAVDLRFVAASGFTATPTTVVFDRNWKVLWSAVGAFNEDYARTALRAIP